MGVDGWWAGSEMETSIRFVKRVYAVLRGFTRVAVGIHPHIHPGKCGFHPDKGGGEPDIGKLVQGAMQAR